MNSRSDRRRFLARAPTAPWIASQAAAVNGAAGQVDEPTLDIHVHLFGVGEGGTGCRLSKVAKAGLP